jgi:excisionase family DNA binding protein
MQTYSTREAAKKLGLHTGTLARYIAVGKLPAPTILKVGTASLHAWTDEDIEQVRQLLPKIANGRKTRYSKLREKEKAQATKPAPRKKRTPKNEVTKPPKANG